MAAINVTVGDKSFDISKPEGLKAFTEHNAALQKALTDAKAAQAEAEERAKKAEAEKTSVTADRKTFRLKVAKYSEKPQKSGPNKGKPHEKAGRPKGTVEIYSCGSMFAINMAVDQWAEIKAKQAEIDAFFEQNKAVLKTMAEILGSDE